MYFLYVFILCYTTNLIPLVNSVVVLTANLNDFKSLAKKYVPNKKLHDQINVMVLETGQNYKRGTYKEDEQVDRTVEYVEEEQDDSDDVQGPVYRYELKTPPRNSLFEPQDTSSINRQAEPTVLTIDDVVDALKHRLLKEIIDKSRDHVQVNTPAKKMQAVAYTNIENKPKRQVKNPIPMKVLKEEVQFEGTYEDTRDKDLQSRIHYLGQVQIPPQYPKRKPASEVSYTKKVVPKKQRFVSLKDLENGAGKKVRYIKQVLVPAKTNRGWSQYIPSPSLGQQIMHQPILGQQPNIALPSYYVRPSILEPQLSLTQQPSLMQQPNLVQQPNLMQQPNFMQQPNLVQQPNLMQQANLMQQPKLLQQPLDQQSSIVKQLSLMQQQIDRLNKFAQQNLAKNEQLDKSTPSTLKAPHAEISAVEAPFEFSINPSSKEDKQKTSKESIVQVDADTLSEETTIEPVTETSTKASSVPTTEENEQFIEENEEDTTGTVENYEAVEETTPEAVTEASSNNEEEEKTVDDTTTPEEEEKTSDDAKKPAEEVLIKSDNAARLGETTKNHTQEFGKSDGQPIVEKTYNFDAPIGGTKAPVKLKLPVDSARKVMLF